MSIKAKVIIGVVAFILAALVLLTIILVTTSLKKLNSDEVGLKYDQFLKTLNKQPFFEGLHSGPPGYEFIIFPSTFKTVSFSGHECMNQEGIPIYLYVSYQYRLQPTHMKEIVEQFTDTDGYRYMLNSIGKSALRDACSKFNTSQFQSQRGIFQEEVRKRLIERYSIIHTDVTDLQVNDIRRPGAYESAIKAKESAREDIEVAKQERPRKLTEARTRLKEAETVANITIQKAESDARIVLNSARAKAEGILTEYRKEADTYKNVMSSSKGLDLDAEGFIAYMGVRTVDTAENPVYVNMKGPVKTDL